MIIGLIDRTCKNGFTSIYIKLKKFRQSDSKNSTQTFRMSVVEDISREVVPNRPEILKVSLTNQDVGENAARYESPNLPLFLI